VSTETVIKVDQVYKNFVLPHERVTSVKTLFTRGFKLKKSSETQHALKDISFEVKKGEFFGIVGRNGSGKSTLLKILAGIYQPTKGSVNVEGKLVPFIELGVGFNPELTGRENVYLNGAMLGFSKNHVDKMYHSIVEFAELEKFMDQKLKNYSSGMQVRLAFSMAIRAEADILLVDEVLAVGDADFQRKCYEYFSLMKKKNKTIVFVTHDMSAVQQFCDRGIFIEKNEIILAGSAQEIANAYSKMFLEEAQERQKKDKKEATSTKSIWGDGAAKFIDPEIVAEKDLITINAKVQANKTLNRPIIGFLVKNTSGQVLFGTNTQKLRIELPKLTAGETRTISWSIPNILNEGIYTVDMAISYSQGITAQWWEDACTTNFYQMDGSPFLVNPRASFDIS